MAELVLVFKKQILKKLPFDKDSLTIGRKPDNDLQIDNLAVSGHHARVDRTGSDFILTDLQSTNGTFINNQKVASHKLRHGDNIVIGKHIIVFVDADKKKEPEAAAPTPPQADMEKTMMLDTAKQREMLAKVKQQAAGQGPTQKPEKVGVITSIDDSGLGEIELAKKLMKIGKAGTADIKLSGMLMGATAATISKRPSGYVITFTGGATKLKVNGQVVQESVPLNDFDTIELGSYKFQFYQK
jgi:pSer/pThr/pTyr-binding forkhead associated (FHA) protein